ncbi:2-C-methyl-D-erythritol 4-phosphate cytidylyltransferase [Thalassotalea sp. Y01]|uniref:2-C-methyl-D-erythritol 4-phosphate cytidylyltransferase n=1 Tax=Thalassotalea sp. Y01 TaxID=2729613 RepID=UPI00145F8821|nr:2-C-methyl-D-erythritol 4-phosphate cytidylyltransferase [Thalassotalea sp. Y01]NMP17657.1 2-C-methyl-D-erythritol 4-phosphate cytidylyltransferase [Thalassotalea sp. Y01]
MTLTSTPLGYTVVVPAAGVGSRMQQPLAKQYLQINGSSIIEHTLNRLLSCDKISQVIVVLSKNDQQFSKLAIASHPNVHTAVGGKERADSVLAGLQAMSEQDWVLVHDAARPCVSHDDIERLIEFCEQSQEGAILATPVRDTMKRANSSGQIAYTEERENMWHALTPQMFPHRLLIDALANGLAENAAITDEASALEYAGQSAHLVSGREDNIKITRPADLPLAAFILSQQESSCE